MSEFRALRVDSGVRSQLQSISRTAEGEVIKTYLRAQLQVLAWKALACDGADLEELQGRAHQVEDMYREMFQERI